MNKLTFETWKTATGELANAPEWAVAVFAGIDHQLEGWGRNERLEITIHAIGPKRRRAVIDHLVVDRTEMTDIHGRTFFVPILPFTPEANEEVWKALSRGFATADGRSYD